MLKPSNTELLNYARARLRVFMMLKARGLSTGKILKILKLYD